MSAGGHDHNPSADRLRRRLERRSRKGLRLWLGVGAALVVPLVALLVAWVVYRGAEARGAARAEQLGGRVTWSEGRTERHVIALSLAGTGVDDAQLGTFTPWWWQFPELSDLDLTGTAITDEGLAHLSGAGIQNLKLGDTKITSHGLAALANCPALSSVSLSKTQVDDSGVEYLIALPELRGLSLEGTPITDAALRRLESVTSLRYLRLGDNRGVTEAGVAALEEALPELKVTRQ
jgi:hypothetical protein